MSGQPYFDTLGVTVQAHGTVICLKANLNNIQTDLRAE